MKQTHQYDDIIGLPHHVSSKRAPMSRIDRAAQFSPFAALTGYEAVIQETGRLTATQAELDEGRKAELNEKLTGILEIIDAQPCVTITYFRPDDRKTGGAYISVTGRVKKLDLYEQRIVLTDGRQIPIGQIHLIDME